VKGHLIPVLLWVYSSESESDDTLAVTKGDSVGLLLNGGTLVVTLSVGAGAVDVDPCSCAMYWL
jgi:hypothetical protein